MILLGPPRDEAICGLSGPLQAAKGQAGDLREPGLRPQAWGGPISSQHKDSRSRREPWQSGEPSPLGRLPPASLPTRGFSGGYDTLLAGGAQSGFKTKMQVSCSTTELQLSMGTHHIPYWRHPGSPAAEPHIVPRTGLWPSSSCHLRMETWTPAPCPVLVPGLHCPSKAFSPSWAFSFALSSTLCF